ncbi:MULTISPECIES: phosphate ABC transporter substrate-binding protein PstS [unclassified Sphingomonas]|uniref:phosphate ABC transporter substrate-binding protein PstS n=1 Tax=unclassified Sphingomonas TaxID=196159 RepID=UPI00092C7DB8|nr:MULTISPECIES: phosphate ABC transporter substrate-binding protein PstS [unclassified Sphingomonas]OJU20155.1 MAG: phosphate ABC transporter substrate-binding protein PstS [Sphingomonas sp. 66-10]
MFKKFVIGTAAVAVGGAAIAADISGAGATFPAPIYARWAEIYSQQAGQRLNYQAIGSGGGIKQIKAKTVDFGASDKPLKPAELQAAGLYQFPTVVGGVVPVVNFNGLRAGRLRLTGQVLGDIFLGKIRRWNDPAITKLNPELKIPGAAITVVHRSDGSGTSFLFTSYLAMKNAEWAKKVGASDAVEWPTGLGGKGNDGVTAFVKQTAGSIGYVEYAYAKQNKLPYVSVQNKAGKFVAADAANFAAAAAGARWASAPGNYLLLLDQPGAQAWPITGATFILLQRNQANAANGAAVLKFFDWAYKNGDAEAAKLDFVPLPAAVKAAIRRQWATNVTSGGKPVYVSR